MNIALWAAKTGLDAQQTRMSVIANNLANVSTTGFKRGRPVFEDLIYQNIQQVGGQTSQETEYPTGLHLGTGVRIVATERSFSQGGLTNTGNGLDIAVNGRGFFEILLPDGTTGYTRDGSFQIDSDGTIVTANGFTLQPGLSVPPNMLSLTIANDGTMTAQVAGSPTPTPIGSIQLADFINPGGLQPRGDNLYVETGASGPPTTGTPGLNGLGLLEQGFLEGSNVNVVEELVTMIETQRAYEMNSKAISTTDQMLQYVNNNL
ncbi:MAG: flagellar basal-body rod protein FlgG [Pseudomonadota bacterium]